MPKAITGAALIAGAVVGDVALGMVGAGALTPYLDSALFSVAMQGVSMEAGEIASALTSNRGMGITTRQAAAYRQIIYGTQRVGGIFTYRSTTGSHKDQFNMVIVIATHEIDSISAIYLDGRQVYFSGGPGSSTRNGILFGGDADSNNHTGPNGVQYNFGGKVYVEARYGDQAEGDVITGLTANDPVWAPSTNGTPWVGGCAYVYLKCEYDPNLFPSEPEVRFTVNGKNNIWDPRTQTTKFTSNWALIFADIITDPVFGLGDNTVNQAQLIAAANVCDEQVPLATPGAGTEARYTCHHHYDTSVGPGDALAAIMPGAAGRLSRIGGEWFIWPAYFQGPSASFDEGSLTAAIADWKPYRSKKDLFNRVNGTYTAANYPYNVAGNLYDSNGYYNGQTQNNFPFAFQPSSFPQYAADKLHGYPADEWLAADGGTQLPIELTLTSVLSISQAQRVAKINLLRNRQQGSGVFEMSLAAFAMQPMDAFNMSFKAAGWTNKLLEVTGINFRVEEQDDSGVQAVHCSVAVAETDASVYEWSTAEELTPYDVPASPNQAPNVPQPPTNMVLNSGTGTTIVAPDKSVIVVIEVTWDTPLDILVTSIQIQYRQTGSTNWAAAPSADVSQNLAYISNVAAGTSYDVRIRSVRANGTASAWVEQDAYAVPLFPSFLGQLGALLPVMYTGLSSNLVPNGNFITKGIDGWATIQGTPASYKTSPLNCIYIPHGSAVSTAAFNVIPGQKYKFIWAGWGGNTGGVYLRLYGASAYAANITGDNYTYYFDLIAAGSLGTDPNEQYVLDPWVCPGGVNYVSMAVYANGDGDVALSLVQAQDYVAAAEWGADQTANQAIAYSGSSESIVPNGSFILGTMQGWSYFNFSYLVDSWGPLIYGIGNSYAQAVSPSFAVVPGQKYRLNYKVYSANAGSGGIYLRINWSPTRLDNISDQTPGNYQDFLVSGSVPLEAPTVYSYDWVCPPGQNYASIILLATGASDLACQYVSCIPYAASAEWGSDVTSNQPIVYSGSSNNLIPNGTFVLGNATGYVLRGSSLQLTNPPQILVGNGGCSAITPTFQVIPGQLYRIQFDGGVPIDGTRAFYHRLFYNSQNFPNIYDGVPGGYTGYTDFLVAGNMADAYTTYTYTWVCPPGVYYASLAVYSIGTAYPGFTRFVAQDFGAASQWGADVTGSNTSLDTNNVDGVPAQTIAQVVPTGYILFVNSGNRSYSLTAV